MKFKVSFDAWYKYLTIQSEDKSIEPIIFRSVNRNEEIGNYWGMQVPETSLGDAVSDKCEDIVDILDLISPAGKNNGILGQEISGSYEADNILGVLNQIHKKVQGFLENKNKREKNSENKNIQNKPIIKTILDGLGISKMVLNLFPEKKATISPLPFTMTEEEPGFLSITSGPETEMRDNPTLRTNFKKEPERSKELYTAIEKDDEKTVKRLLESRIDPDQGKMHASSDPPPISLAVNRRYVPIIKLLLERYAEINELSFPFVFGHHHFVLTNFLHEIRHQSIGKNEIEIIALLLEHKANLYWEDEDHQTPLMLAMSIKGEDNRKAIIDLLIKAGLDINKEDYLSKENEGTPLTSAIKKDKIEAVKLLLEFKAAINATYRGEGPLQFSACYDRGDILKLLLEKKADINYFHAERLAFGYIYSCPPALHYTVKNNNKGLTGLLLEAKADPNGTDTLNTPLYLATAYRGLDDVPCMDVLLKYGANPFMENRGGETPMSAAGPEVVEKINQSPIVAKNTQYLLKSGFFSKEVSENIQTVTDKPFVDNMKPEKIYKQDRGTKGLRAFWLENNHRCIRDFTTPEIEKIKGKCSPKSP